MYATGEPRTVTRPWTQYATCRHLLKQGRLEMFYTPNKVFRCADCARQAPHMRTAQDVKPIQLPSDALTLSSRSNADHDLGVRPPGASVLL